MPTKVVFFPWFIDDIIIFIGFSPKRMVLNQRYESIKSLKNLFLNKGFVVNQTKTLKKL